jgi:hypothetical protein
MIAVVLLPVSVHEQQLQVHIIRHCQCYSQHRQKSTTAWRGTAQGRYHILSYTANVCARRRRSGGGPGGGYARTPAGTHPHLRVVGNGNPMAVSGLARLGSRRDGNRLL